MKNNQTIGKLKSIRLSAVTSLHKQYIQGNSMERMIADEYTDSLTYHQWEERQNNKIERLIKQVGFREKANIADIS